jgi:hypothetical protein
MINFTKTTLTYCFVLFTFLLGSLNVLQAQNVTKAEYYIDADPGIGKAVNIPVAAGLDVNASFSVNVNALSTGFHNLFIRSFVVPYSTISSYSYVVNGDTKIIKDTLTKGGWSLTNKRTLFKENLVLNNGVAPNVVKGEYFVDTDPGFNSATNIPVVQGNDLTNVAFTLDVTAFSAGFHRLYVRFKDANGGWSLANVRTFYKESVGGSLSPLPNVVKGEYYIDTDPGFGAGKNIPVTPGTEVTNVTFSVDVNALAGGFHTLFTRFKDANNNWSITNRRTFYKENFVGSDLNIPNIVAGEYFIDTDNGFGSGKNIPVTPGTNLNNISFTTDVSSLGEGFHKLYARFKNANGSWGQTNLRRFYKASSSSASTPGNITNLEYFIDTDPGFGKGIKLPVTPAVNISDLTFVVPDNAVTVGNHRIYIRARNASGEWSLTHSRNFEIKPPADLLITIGTIADSVCAGAPLAVPFKVNFPYGSNNVFTAQLSNSAGQFTNPVSIGTINTSNSDTIDAIIPANTSAGTNYRIRIISSSPADTSGASTTNLRVKALITPTVSIAASATTICAGTAVTLTATANGTVVWNTGQTTLANTVAPAATTTYSVKVTSPSTCTTAPFAEMFIKINVFKTAPAGTPVITTSGRQLFASAPPVTDSISGYQWYKDNVVIGGATASTYFAATDGTYTVRFVNLCGNGPLSTPVVVSAKQSQVVTFDSIPDKTYGDARFVLKAIASSGMPVTYAVVGGSGTITVDSFTIANAGTITIRASQAGDNTFNAAFTDRTFNVKKATAIVVLSNLSKVYNGSGQTTSVVTTPAGLPVTFLFDNNSNLPVNAGTYSVVATINSTNYSGTTSGSFVIQKANQTIALGSIPDMQLNTPYHKVIASSSSGLPVSIALTTTPNGIATLKNDTIFVSAFGTGVITASQAGNSNYNSALNVSDTFLVKKTAQTISFPAITNKIVNVPPFSISATSSSGLPVTFTIVSGPASLSNNVITLTDTGSVTVEANQFGNASYFPASPVQQTFRVNPIVTAPDIAVQSVTSGTSLIAPGDSITVTWKVANVGSAASPTDWEENIYIQSINGDNRTLLKQSTFSNASLIEVNKSINRTARVAIPAQLNIGDQGVLVVELKAGSSLKEADATSANNTGMQASPLDVKKLLTISLSADQLTEGAAGINVTINRSGSYVNNLTVTISLKNPARFEFPATLTIPAGQGGATFVLKVPENNTITGTLHDTVSASAPNFQAISAALVVLDNDKPSLTITQLPLSAMEGSTVTFKVSTNLVPTAPMQVFLTSANQARFPVPASVTIPAGSLSTDVVVSLVQDNVPEVDIDVEVNAGAANHNSAKASILIKDDDLPGLVLEIQTTKISEDAGFFATQATLRRAPNSNSSAFTAKLSADLANALILPSSISLAANENAKTFTVGVIDNALVDGERMVAINASIFVNSCGCSAPPASAGSVTANIAITDNDGAALTLTASSLTLVEGQTDAGTLRVTRNTGAAQPLVVKLTSSNTAEATLPATATIPAGQVYVEVPITTINDGLSDGNKQVYFEGTSNGYSQGSVWVVVTDLNKPDFQITAAVLPVSTLQAMTVFNYQVSIKNSGFATASAGVMVRGYLSSDNILDDADSLITEDVITEAIGQGQTIQVVNAATVPNLPGQHKLLFKVNPLSAVTELLLTNNISQPVSIIINPDYTANAIVSNAYYVKGSKIAITGLAKKTNGTAAANAQVEVYVITNGIRREIIATTNNSGSYSTEFAPLGNEVGHYTVGATYPGLKLSVAQDEFDILGVQLNEGNIPKFKVILNETIHGTMPVKNLSNTDLTGFSLLKVSLPNGALISFDTLAVLKGNVSMNIGFTVSGNALSAGSNFEVANLKAVSKEATIQNIDMFYFCQASNGLVSASITNINVSSSQSAGEKLVEFKLFNRGQGNSGKININLPQVTWLKSVTPVELPSLVSGDSTLVVLKFSALPDVPFNYPISGNIGITSQNGNSFIIPYKFEKVSETSGSVKITVTNQFTYYSDAEPKVKDALVTIKNYYTGEVYAEGNSDQNGVFEAGNIPEGTHRIMVEKEKHLPYNGTIVISPGKTIESTIFINYQAITFNWSVVPTAVQDEYDITLMTQFETDVPIPVVTIDMPKTMPQLSGTEVYAFNATLTNHGLITAKDVTITLPTGDAEYEFVTNYVPSDLLAQQSIQVPVIMRRRTGGPRVAGRPSLDAISQFLGIQGPQLRGLSGANCTDFTGVVYWYKCSISSGLWEKGGTLFTYSGRSCTNTNSNNGGGGGIDPNVWGAYQNAFPTCALCPDPGIFAGDPNWTNPYTNEKKSCVECLNELGQAIAGCLGINIPPELACAVNTAIDKGGPKAYALCLLQSAIENIASKLPYVGQILCLKSILGALATCLATAEGREEFDPANFRTTGSALGDAFLEIHNNLTVVSNAYNLQVKWNTEYFGELSANGSWSTFSPMVTPYVLNFDTIPKKIQDSIISAMSGYDMQASEIKAFFRRWNASVQARNLDILSPNSQYPDIINWSLVKKWSDSLVDNHNYAIAKGFASIDDMNNESRASMDEVLENQNKAVCASVTVQLSQKLTMTREAFEGTLEIFNGHPSDKMDSLSVNIQITDEDGIPSNGLFEIQTKSLTNLANVTGAGMIASQQKGSVKFIFIPEVGAAPESPKVYNFGGSVRYFDPYVDAMVTMPLSNVPLTVNPSPNLFLHYFLQRNILGDDALTSPDIEPSIPAELAVMVENQGYGPAVNMTISSAQPKITDNEKGLAIEFKLIGSNFQGQPKNLGATNINFGTIPPLQTRIGQWYLTSSLLGKFVSYQASVVHANSMGNPDLSLVKGVKLHELTKSIRVYGGLSDGINDFLVNDVFDIHDIPDVIYYSQGNRTEKVYAAKTGSFSSLVGPPAFTNTLNVTPVDTGWNYIKLDDPGNKRYEIQSVTRSDGQVIPLDNAWLTFVTLPVSQSPKYENKFHFIDSFPSLVPVSYTVVWKPANLDVPKIVKILGVTEPVVSKPITELTVVFDKSIDAATFNYEDLSLAFQGGPNIINSSVKVTRIDSVTFKIDLSALTTGNGFYNLTVQAANIKDVFGINGQTGRNITWTQFLTVPTVQAFQGIPSGNIGATFETINVLFNLPIDITSVTAARFSVYKDSVLIPGTVYIDSVSKDHKLFYLSGLSSILTQSGVYEFRVDLRNIKSETQVNGVQVQSVKLTVDNEGPKLVTIEKAYDGGIDPQHVAFVNMKFNEELFGFNIASVRLTRNGEVLPLNITQLSNSDLKNWKAGYFGLLTYPDGNYTFSVYSTGFTDAIGNFGKDTTKISWTVNHNLLVKISAVAVSPDRGFSGTDGITSGQTLNLSFTLDSDASQVTISQTDLSGENVLAILSNVTAGKVSIPFTLPTGGNTGLKITAVGASGGVGTGQVSFFLDQVQLTGNWQLENNRELTTQLDSARFAFSAKLLTDAALLNAVELRKNGIVLPANAFKFLKVNDTLYNIYNMRKIDTLPGKYSLTLDLEKLNKYSSGIEGAGLVTLSWTVLSNNRAPLADAGKDTTVIGPGIVKLNGTSSYDPDLNPITYRWIAPAGIVLTDSTSATPSFTIGTLSQDTSFKFLLIVSDGSLFTTDVVNVIVNITSSDPLPVTLVKFDVVGERDKVKLLWSTATEVNTKAFEVQRSIDGSSFTNIGKVSAAGNSTTLTNYQFNDAQAMQFRGMLVYYRILQTDLNGQGKYTDVKTIRIAKQASSLSLLYNPVRHEAVLKYDCVDKGKVMIRVVDLAGRVVMMKEVSADAGMNQIRINTALLVQGMYEVELVSSKDHQHVRMVKE